MSFDKIKEFLEKMIKNRKKSDWIALALTGILLLVIALPTSSPNTKTVAESEGEKVQTAKEAQNEDKNLEYAACLEEKLEAILEQMDGAGKVRVMITLADGGESVVEKDTKEQTNEVTETDASGGSRTTTNREYEQATVYVDDGSNTYPYIGKEISPQIEGVLVVTEGGGNKTVVSEISEVVMALFHVEAHKIKVVKMSSMEE